jgi:hypothetical protein
MKKLDQGHLHPLLEHLETNMSWLGIKPGPSASPASILFEQLILLRTSTYQQKQHGACSQVSSCL